MSNELVQLTLCPAALRAPGHSADGQRYGERMKTTLPILLACALCGCVAQRDRGDSRAATLQEAPPVVSELHVGMAEPEVMAVLKKRGREVSEAYASKAAPLRCTLALEDETHFAGAVGNRKHERQGLPQRNLQAPQMGADGKE